MRIESVPAWLRFALGLILIMLAGICLPRWYGIAFLLLGVPLLISGRLQVFREANDEWQRRRSAERREE